MRLVIEIDREEDGRWIAEVPDLPGVMVYGSSRDSAVAAVQALVFRTLADRLEHRELSRVEEVLFVRQDSSVS